LIYNFVKKTFAAKQKDIKTKRISCLEILRLGIVEVSHDEVRAHCLQEVWVQHPAAEALHTFSPLIQ
jgi:hypothetical protein